MNTAQDVMTLFYLRRPHEYGIGAQNARSKANKMYGYTRVMGYHRPVESFNIGKKQEHKERAHFCERTMRYEYESAL